MSSLENLACIHTRLVLRENVIDLQINKDCQRGQIAFHDGGVRFQLIAHL